MRNLRKYFAVFVAVAMLVTAMAPVFAADTATTATPAPAALTDAKVVETLGMLKGEGGTVSEDYLKTTVTRLQAAIMALRLKGLESAALAFTGKENFADADKVEWDGGKAILAYLKANKDLGWQGDGTNFDPNATISAQDYYKTLLVSLGYVEGKDFQYADTLKFAESKGLKAAAKAETFTINDVAVSTVEALKATMNGKTATLLATLVDAKAIDTAKAQAAGLMSTVISKFDLTNGAKTLTAKFDVAPADATKVVFTTTRDGIAVTFAFTQDATDKTLFKYTSGTNLVTGEYKVAVKNDTADLGSKTLKIENEKIAKIEFAGKLVNRRSDTEGISYYKVTNQYGEDVTKSSIAANISWNSSLGKGTNGADINGDKGIITVSKNDTSSTYMNKLKDYTTIVVTAYDVDSNVSMSETLNVSTTVGDMQSVKLLGISNKDKKTVIEKATNDIFYIDYEIKDSLGNLVTDYAILSNTNSFKLSPGTSSESSIAYAEVVQDPNDNKKALIQIKQPTNTNAGTQVMSAYSIGTGKSANISVEVKEGATLTQFILQRPATDVAINDGLVEIPFTALDGNGKQLTLFNDIYTKVNFTLPANVTKEEIRNSDGTYKLMLNFGSSKTTYTVTATVTTTATVKMSTMNVSVKDAAYPYDITALNLTECAPGVVYTKAVDIRPDRLTIVDQYGRPISLRFANGPADNGLTQVGAVGGLYAYTSKEATPTLYYVAVSSSDQTVMTVASATNITYMDGTKNYAYIAGKTLPNYTPAASVDGLGTKSANLNFSLRKIKVSDITNGQELANLFSTTNQKWTEVDSFSSAVYNVDRKEITKYAFDAVTTSLYASDSVTSSVYYNAGATDLDKAWEQEFKLRGYYNGNIRTEIPNGDYTLYSVNDANKFTISYANTGANSTKVIARQLGVSETTAKTVLSATVKGYNNVFTSASIDIASDKSTPAAASIVVNRNDFVPVLSIGGDFYQITKANFNALIAAGQYVTKYRGSVKTDDGIAGNVWPGANTGRAAIYFTVKDQYGKEGSTPAQILVTRTDATGALIGANQPTVTNGLFALNDAALTGLPLQYFKFTVIAANGVTKTATLIVKD